MGLPMTLSLLVTFLSVLDVYGNTNEDEYKEELQVLGLLQREPRWHYRRNSRRWSSRYRQQRYRSSSRYSNGYSNQFSGGLSNQFSNRRWPGHHESNRRRKTRCVGVSGRCDAVFYRCCGTAQCYWERGYSMRMKGVCVNCVPENGKCQRNSQCCTGLQCEKGNFLWLDGNCKPKRSSGNCYQDSQCQTDCNKKWWGLTGECE